MLPPLPEPDESLKPISEKIRERQATNNQAEQKANKDSRTEVANEQLHHATIRQKLNDARIEAFKDSIRKGMYIVTALIVLLFITIITYLLIIMWVGKEQIPSDFWHIPLMLAFMSSTILSVILIQTAKFGALDNKAKDEQETSLNQNIPLLKELGDFIEKVKK